MWIKLMSLLDRMWKMSSFLPLIENIQAAPSHPIKILSFFDVSTTPWGEACNKYIKDEKWLTQIMWLTKIKEEEKMFLI